MITSEDATADETPAEVCADVLVHFWEIEFAFVKLIGNLWPKTGFTGAKDFTDVSTICTIVTDQISV